MDMINAYIMELPDGCTDLCGVTAPIGAAVTKSYESQIVSFLKTTTTYITADASERDVNKFHEAVALITSLMHEKNDTELMHVKLEICKKYMEEWKYNSEMTDAGKHVFYRMNMEDVLALQRDTDVGKESACENGMFKAIETMQWITNCHDLESFWLVVTHQMCACSCS